MSCDSQVTKANYSTACYIQWGDVMWQSGESWVIVRWCHVTVRWQSCDQGKLFYILLHPHIKIYSPWHCSMPPTPMHSYLWMKTVDIPRVLAMAQACCPPAPPKHARTCLAVSYPLPWKKEQVHMHPAWFISVEANGEQRGREEGAEGTGHRESKKGKDWGRSEEAESCPIVFHRTSLIIVLLAHLRQGSDWSIHCFNGSPASGLWLVDTLFQWLTCVRALIGRHIASLATRINPMATSWVDMGVWVGPSCSWRKVLTCGGGREGGEGRREGGERERRGREGRGRGEDSVVYLCLSDVMVYIWDSSRIRARRHLIGQCFKHLHGNSFVKRFIFIWTKDLGKVPATELKVQR